MNDQFRSILPNNALVFERVMERVSGQRLETLPVRISDLWNPEKCPENFMPWLAWTLSVDDWNANWSLEIKKKVLHDSINVHKKKGTLGAVKDALKAVDVDISITEWFADRGSGEPYTFDADITLLNKPLTEETLSEIYRIIDNTKNVRSTYKVKARISTDSGRILYSTFLIDKQKTTIVPAIRKIEYAPLNLNLVGVIKEKMLTIIYPGTSFQSVR